MYGRTWPPLTCKGSSQTLEEGSEAETRAHLPVPRGGLTSIRVLGTAPRPGDTTQEVLQVCSGSGRRHGVRGGDRKHDSCPPPSATSLCRPTLHGLIICHSGHRAAQRVCKCLATPAPVPPGAGSRCHLPTTLPKAPGCEVPARASVPRTRGTAGPCVDVSLRAAFAHWSRVDGCKRPC